MFAQAIDSPSAVPQNFITCHDESIDIDFDVVTGFMARLDIHNPRQSSQHEDSLSSAYLTFNLTECHSTAAFVHFFVSFAFSASRGSELERACYVDYKAAVSILAPPAFLHINISALSEREITQAMAKHYQRENLNCKYFFFSPAPRIAIRKTRL